jgi:hypothetical protein
MGCITRLGCLFMLVVLAAIGWYTRDRWLARLDLHQSHVTATPTAEHWQPLSDAAGDSARAAVERLAQPRGQVFETLSPAAVASYIYGEASRRLPNAADSVEATAVGGKLSVRAVVSLSNLGSAITDAVGIVHDRERVELTGTLDVFKPGVAEFAVSDARIHGLPIPKGMIATLIDRFEPGRRPAGMDPNSLPLPIPRYIGDIRVANGKITLYKTVR